MKSIKIKLIITVISLLLICSCSEQIVTDCKPEVTVDNKLKASLADIQDKVLTPTCAVSGCHAGTYSPNLTAGSSFNNIVGVDNIAGNMQYVEKGNSANSFLIKKLLGDGTTIMPSGGPKLDQDIIDTIRVWIDNGAENN